MSRSHPHHHAGHDKSGAGLRFGLLTISDTRTEADDVSGPVLRELVEAGGHAVHAAAIVHDEIDAIRERVSAWAADVACDVIVSSGGTGLAPRDRTVEAIEALLDHRIEGFGELFRSLSYQQIGAAAMLSRALAGVIRGTPVFVLPGSPAAVRLAMSSLVLPEIGHVVRELRRR